MLQHISFKPSIGKIAAGLLALASLVVVEHMFKQAGLWLFLGLSLSTGFFHGALDILMLQREFPQLRRLIGMLLLYLLSAVAVATLCVLSGKLMVMLLLGMSVWHFGEPYGRWANAVVVKRLIVGGAPVMLPALVSAHELNNILPLVVGGDAAWVSMAWQTLAWAWLGLCGLSLVVLRQDVLRQQVLNEVGAVLVLNLALSPMAAFALYFGLFHAVEHMQRVELNAAKPAFKHPFSSDSQSNHRIWGRITFMPLLLTCVATAALLFGLVYYLWLGLNEHSGQVVQGVDQSVLLSAVLIGLTAVTFPHLILVSRCSGWLANKPAKT